MMETFWWYFHTPLFFFISIIYMITDTIRETKEVQSRLSKTGKEKSLGFEVVLRLAIVMMVFCAFLYCFIVLYNHNSIIVIAFLSIYLFVNIYIALKQMIKMIFIPDNKRFLLSDIKDFLYMYMFWWALVLVVSEGQQTNDLAVHLHLDVDFLHVLMLLLWYYFNLLFALGGIYITMYYVITFTRKIVKKHIYDHEKIKSIRNKIVYIFKWRNFNPKLKSISLWQNGQRKIIYKILMTVPCFVVDICLTTFALVLGLLKITIIMIVLPFADSIRIISKYAPQIWNKYENNEWMYMFAQIAGLCSYIIVLIIVQYGDYKEATKTVYEVIGTIIWIPYFINRIMKINKADMIS